MNDNKWKSAQKCSLLIEYVEEMGDDRINRVINLMYGYLKF